VSLLLPYVSQDTARDTSSLFSGALKICLPRLREIAGFEHLSFRSVIRWNYRREHPLSSKRGRKVSAEFESEVIGELVIFQFIGPPDTTTRKKVRKIISKQNQYLIANITTVY
jgi:hypothetical protein